MYDLCMIYNDDAEVWSQFVLDHLGKEQFKLRLLTLTDLQLVNWLSSADTATATSYLRDAAEARAFIVVVSPGHVRILNEHPELDYHCLVPDPRRAQLLLWGVELSDISAQPTMLISRFPRFDVWSKVTPDRHDQLLKTALKTIESVTTSPKTHSRRSHCTTSQRQHQSAYRHDSVPDEPPPPLPPPHGLSQRRTSGRTSTASTYRRRRKRDFQIQPNRARCEEQTQIFILFDEPFDDVFPEMTVDVIIGDVMSEMCVKTSAECLNPYTFMFEAPAHPECVIPIKVLVDGADIGDSQLTYYSLLADVLTGISQIYLQQLGSLLDAILPDQQTPDKPVPLPAIPGAQTKTVWTSAAVDRLMIRLFNEDDEEAAERKIPSQAFEQLFGIYNMTGESESVTYECPSLLHLASRHNLRVLTARLVDLPDARLACNITDSCGRRAEDVARLHGHQSLASFLTNFRTGEAVSECDMIDGASAGTRSSAEAIDDSRDDVDGDRGRSEDVYMIMTDAINNNHRKKSKDSTADRASDDESHHSDYEKMDDEMARMVALGGLTYMKESSLSVEKDKDDDEDSVTGSDYERMDEVVHSAIQEAGKKFLAGKKKSETNSPVAAELSSSPSEHYFFMGDARSSIADGLKSATEETNKGKVFKLPELPSDLTETDDSSESHQEPAGQQELAENDPKETYFDMGKPKYPLTKIDEETTPTSAVPSVDFMDLTKQQQTEDSVSHVADMASSRCSLTTMAELISTPCSVSDALTNQSLAPPPAPMSSSQQELIEIMRQVKAKELSMSDAETLFYDWQMRHNQGLSKSMKQKQESLSKLRQELAHTTDKSVKKKSSFSLPRLRISKKHPKTPLPAHTCTGDECCSPAPVLYTATPSPKQGIKSKFFATPSCADSCHSQEGSVRPPLLRESSTSTSSECRESDASRTSGVADVDTVDEDLHPSDGPDGRRRHHGQSSCNRHTSLARRKSKNMEMLEENLSLPGAFRPPPLPPRPRKLSLPAIHGQLPEEDDQLLTPASAPEATENGHVTSPDDSGCSSSDPRYVTSPISSESLADTPDSTWKNYPSAAMMAKNLRGNSPKSTRVIEKQITVDCTGHLAPTLPPHRKFSLPTESLSSAINRGLNSPQVSHHALSPLSSRMPGGNDSDHQVSRSASNRVGIDRSPSPRPAQKPRAKLG